MTADERESLRREAAEQAAFLRAQSQVLHEKALTLLMMPEERRTYTTPGGRQIVVEPRDYGDELPLELIDAAARIDEAASAWTEIAARLDAAALDAAGTGHPGG